ncbi:uncharacterized protein LOC125500652 [Athalia rosae]|uniref:uncharacterized protein LOC125500652 n=1 Tax=Athalia rosae TaxID=37344 RepID=UPI0020345880|nr:uncharacterized protein LOC125500652 [Athalia rosae]
MGSGSCFGSTPQPPSAPPPILSDPMIRVHRDPGITRVTPCVIGQGIMPLGPQTMTMNPGLVGAGIVDMRTNFGPFGGFGVVPGYCGRGFGGGGFGSCGGFGGGGFGGRF